MVHMSYLSALTFYLCQLVFPTRQSHDCWWLDILSLVPVSCTRRTCDGEMKNKDQPAQISFSNTPRISLNQKKQLYENIHFYMTILPPQGFLLLLAMKNRLDEITLMFPFLFLRLPIKRSDYLFRSKYLPKN